MSTPRGLALKIIGVDGERLPDAGGHTQDFVMVNGPVFQAKTAEKFDAVGRQEAIEARAVCMLTRAPSA